MNNDLAPVTAAAPALAALRQATRERHTHIDRLMDLRRLTEPAHYHRILQVFAAFLGPWEQAVAAALPLGLQPWLRQRSRRPFLVHDLHALRLPPLDRPVTPPHLESAAAGWGSLYVMEGSALGGQAIARVLARTGLDAHHGGAYFHGWGERTPALWQEFRERLERALDGPGARAAACDAACRTFDTLSDLLESELHERPALA